MSFLTADLYDEFAEACASCEVQFRQFGGNLTFSGKIRTIQCHADNALVRRACETPSPGEVLVVDGSGSLGWALMGDQIAALALHNGLAGVVIFGVIRDSVALRTMNLGVKALGTNPRKSGKAGTGEVNVPVTFGGVTFRPGEWLYSDDDGILVSPRDLFARP